MSDSSGTNVKSGRVRAEELRTQEQQRGRGREQERDAGCGYPSVELESPIGEVVSSPQQHKKLVQWANRPKPAVLKNMIHSGLWLPALTNKTKSDTKYYELQLDVLTFFVR